MMHRFRATHRVLAAAALAGALTTGPWATTASAAVAVEQTYAQASTIETPTVNARTRVDQARDAYLERAGFSLGALNNPGGAYIGWGTATVAVSPEDARFGQFRAVAAQQAFLNAQTQFIAFMNQQTTTDLAVSQFSDSGDADALRRDLEAERAPKGRLRLIAEKALAVTEAKLDQLLIDLGVDPAEIEGKTRPEKVTLYKDSTLRRTLTQAVGQSAGVRVLNTFEGIDENGLSVIGVLIVQSPTFRALASALRQDSVAGLQGKPGRPIPEQVNAPVEQMVDNFGVRVLFDENGDRALVSFGQWAIRSGGGSARAVDRRRQTALDQARMQADAQLAEFAAGSVAFASESLVGQVVEEYVNRHPDGFQEAGELEQLVDRLQTDARVTAELRIRGLADIRTWTAKHPVTGHEIVGVVRMWSPTTRRQVDVIERGPQPERSGDGDGVVREIEGSTRTGTEFEESF